MSLLSWFQNVGRASVRGPGGATPPQERRQVEIPSYLYQTSLRAASLFQLITATILTPFISASKKKTESARTTLHNNLRRLAAASLFSLSAGLLRRPQSLQSAFDWPGFPTRYPLSISFWFLFQDGLWERIHLGEWRREQLRTLCQAGNQTGMSNFLITNMQGYCLKNDRN